MQNQKDTINTSSHLSSDMATTLKMLDPFSGNTNEDSNKWIQKLLAKCQLLGLDENSTRIVSILLLKGIAEDWYLDNKDELQLLSLKHFFQRMSERFTTQVSTEKILEKFLARGAAITVQEYEELLAKAKTLASRRSISGF